MDVQREKIIARSHTGRARLEPWSFHCNHGTLLLRNPQLDSTGTARSFVLLTSFYWQLRALRRNSNRIIKISSCLTASPISPPQPLGSRMRILFGVSLIYSTLLCDKENPFPTKLQLLSHPNKHYTPGTHQNKNKLIFKYPWKKHTHTQNNPTTIRSIKTVVPLCVFGTT